MTRKGIIIVGHGSRYEYNKKIMELQAERLKNMGYKDIYIGFNETSSPRIAETVARMADDGIDEIVALPFFIASGIHMEKEIPEKLGLESYCDGGAININGHNLIMHYEKPFGNDPLLSKILFERITELDSAKGHTGVIVVGHGSRLPYNKQTIELHTDLLRKMGIRNVYSAFNEFNEPSVEDVMNKLLLTGVDEIIVLPLFISLGDHLKNDIPAKIKLKDGINEDSFQHDGRTVTVKYALPIGQDPRLTEILSAKIDKY